jgi:hypothetical protein
MEKITLYNYEIYLLELSEGNISTERYQTLMKFLKIHPELVPDLMQLELPVLPAETENSGLTEVLLRDNTFDSDREIFEYAEGQLTGKTLNDFERRLNSDPQLRQDVTLFKSLVLKPDLSVSFEHKSTLHKSNFVNEHEYALQPEQSLMFPHKATLYREARTYRLFPPAVQRAAAALVVLLFAALVASITKNNPPAESKLHAVTPILPSIKPKAEVITESTDKPLATLKNKKRVYKMRAPEISKSEAVVPAQTEITGPVQSVTIVGPAVARDNYRDSSATIPSGGLAQTPPSKSSEEHMMVISDLSQVPV